jgi:glycosyltransferase involved in cell wall biosynthesis
MKILFVAMHISIHTARWLAQLKETGWDIYLFPVHFENPHPHPSIKGITLFRQQKFSNVPVDDSINVIAIEDYLPFYKRLLSKFGSLRQNHGYWLARIIDKLAPDIVHSMEMQHSAYMTCDARRYCKRKFPQWIYSCWGSDIYYYQQFDEHRARIGEVLEKCDYLFTDTKRDVALARKYGFSGELLGVFPGVGGFKLDEMRLLASFVRPSARKTVVIKGYTGWVYRPFTILAALHECVAALQGYSIAIYLPVGDEIVERAKELCRKIGTELIVLNYGPHEDVLKLFASARISLASSISDGTPNSMLESMTMGAFPIQSDTVSTGEWIENGVNGFLAGPEDVTAYVEALQIALSDDALVDRAAEENYRMLKDRIDYSLVQPQVLNAYEKVYRTVARR